MSSLAGFVSGVDRPPRLWVAPSRADTRGPLAAKFAADYGLTLDPWQRLVLDDWLAEQEDGRYAALTCGLACPRQNGKNAILEVRELAGMVGRGERILHSAHQVKTARKAFKRLLHFFGREVNDRAAKFPELNALVTELRHVNGQEAIFLSNGGSVELIARSKDSGRGFTVDTLVMDEAQELSDDDLEALIPTTAAAPLGDPQWLFTGTPPGPRAAGEVFTRARAEALASSSGRIAWHEWSVDVQSVDDIDLNDRGHWFATNPALGGRLQLDVAAGERARFSPEGFARERLGWWQPRDAQLAALPLEVWRQLADLPSARGGRRVFAVATDPDRAKSAVAVAWQRPDGLSQVELADYRAGTDWVSRRVAELRRQWGGVVLLDTPSRGLVGGAEEPSQQAQARAHNALADAVAARSVRHDNAPALNVSVRSARWRPLGDTRTLERKGNADISPLIAAALAFDGLTTTRPTGGWMVGL